VADDAPKQEFSREVVRRKLGVSEQQLRSWERERLIAPAGVYSFSDLIALKTLIKLRENHIPARQIGRAVESLKKKLASVDRPLSELRIASNGRTITVRVAGRRMEAISGQMLFDFETAELGDLRSFPEAQDRAANRVQEAETWFQKGLELEEMGAPADQAVEAYQKAVEANPGAAGAWVNLGTIRYRQRRFAEAEELYRKALEVDPRYALALFNLGNLYDEQGDLEHAREHYQAAVGLNQQYADAHFNLALVCEKSGETLKAVHHWRIYLKLDPTGTWADIARRQLDKLRQATLIHSRQIN
jgi:tetratricopeptide (TPR) repeat protein